MTSLIRTVFKPSAARVARDPRPIRAWTLAIASGVLVSLASVVMMATGLCTAFAARRLYRGMARGVALAILGLYGIRLRVDAPEPLPQRQTVFVSNHTSSLDLFVLVALGLPDCRFFLSGFLRRLLPLGAIAWLLGTFFTVPQDRPAERVRIFERAERILRRTGESVYLSPEGERITSGGPGHFNKGAFHLATNLGAPIVPFYICIPATVDPRLGFDARPGVIDVHFLPAIDTRTWTLAALDSNVALVRDQLVRLHEDLSCAA